MRWRHWLATGWVAAATVVSAAGATVTVGEHDGKAALLVDGAPFVVRGVTFSRRLDDPVRRAADFARLQDLGVNCLRNWGCGEDTQLLLDTAAAHDLKVILGLWLRHGRPGAEGDDNFNYLSDDAGMAAQRQATLAWVRRFKDHPALLAWGLGNEVILNLGTEAEKLAYAKHLEDVAAAIKREDPAHPVVSADAWTLAWPYWRDHCPSLDIYGVNTYGPGVQAIPGEVRRLQVDKPILYTEFGPRGEWDAPKDRNGLGIEPDDAEKFDTILQGCTAWWPAQPTCLGGFVFNFGDDENHGGIWLNLMVGKSFRPSYWAVRQAYAGTPAANLPPVVEEFRLPRDTATAGEWIPVSLAVRDPEGEPLEVEFRYNHRVGDRQQRDAVLPLASRRDGDGAWQVQAPTVAGVVKVYVFVRDPFPNLSIAQLSLAVRPPGAPQATPGERRRLPLAIYDEEPPATPRPYVPSGLMGHHGMLAMIPDWTENPQAGKTCLKVTYRDSGGWVGAVWQHPANDWGGQPGGFDLGGATALVFHARGETGGEKVSFGFGMINRDQPFFDTAKGEIKDAVLTAAWQEYRIPLAGLDLSRIKSGFYFVLGGQPGGPTVFYLDEVRYE